MVDTLTKAVNQQDPGLSRMLDWTEHKLAKVVELKGVIGCWMCMLASRRKSPTNLED